MGLLFWPFRDTCIWDRRLVDWWDIYTLLEGWESFYQRVNFNFQIRAAARVLLNMWHSASIFFFQKKKKHVSYLMAFNSICSLAMFVQIEIIEILYVNGLYNLICRRLLMPTLHPPQSFLGMTISYIYVSFMFIVKFYIS